MSILYEKEGYAIRGALFEVHKNLGIGFIEEVYQMALEMELALCGVPFEPQKEFTLSYKGVALPKTFRADVVCYGKIILELKAADCLLEENELQLINYLKATDKEVGLLLNFGKRPEIRRKAFDNDRKKIK